MSMPEICFLVTGLNVGGAEVQVVSLAKRLQLLGWKPSVISMLPADGRLADELRSFDIGVYSLNMRAGSPNPQAIFSLITILRRLNPAILHSHMWHANLLARVVRLFLWRAPKLVCTIHSGKETGYCRQLSYRATDFIPNRTTTVSRAAGARCVKMHTISAGKLSVLPNGVDVARFKANLGTRLLVRQALGLNSQFAWLAVGRLEFPKDYPNMLRAFSRLPTDNAVLLIAGVGPQKDELQNLIQELHIADRVRLLGLRSDIPELMNAADGYVMSSRWESLPMVLLEAAATGLPIVATRVGGIDEIVLDGATGRLVEPNNSDMLADAMSRIMRVDSCRIQEMSRVARQHVETNYSLDTAVAQWEALYHDLLQFESTPEILRRPSPTAAR